MDERLPRPEIPDVGEAGTLRACQGLFQARHRKPGAALPGYCEQLLGPRDAGEDRPVPGQVADIERIADQCERNLLRAQQRLKPCQPVDGFHRHTSP